MTESLPPESPDEIVARPAALRLGAALLAAFALIAVLAFLDREARPRLEAAREAGPAEHEPARR